MKYCEKCKKRFACWTTDKPRNLVFSGYVNTAKGVQKMFAPSEAEKKIKSEIAHNGHYSHNIISLVLRAIAKECGKDAANSLIDECRLEKLGWKKEE